MRKLVSVILLSVVIMLSSGCSKTEIELSDFVNAYNEAGYDASLEEKPLFTLIEAKDGVIFYINGDKVAIYEYKTPKLVKEANFEFNSINGRFGIETSNSTAIGIFDIVGSKEYSEKIGEYTNLESGSDNTVEQTTTVEVSSEEAVGEKNGDVQAYADIDLEKIAIAYQEKGYEVDLEEKPLFQMIGAIDGVIFYVDGQKVAIYEFEDEAQLKEANFEFNAEMGRYGLESKNQNAQDIFNSIKGK